DVDRMRLYIDGVYYNTVGLRHAYDNVHFYLPWEQRLDLSDTAVFEFVSIDKRGREGERMVVTPDIRVQMGWNNGDYKFRARVGRGTHRVVIKDADGRVMDAKDFDPTQYWSFDIPLDHTQYKHGETYYVYGVDSKGNEGPPGEYVYEATNASYESFTPAAEIGWPVGGDAR
ncbi:MULTISPECIES: hypothetical protein, partial [unclassified Exiguobacterium]|uniref:hypothetical protein n=1 Tax=unclassified Exiguobacterium TaxID=2644629 RepID=UPI001F40C40D